MNYSSYDSVGLLALVCGGATKKIEQKKESLAPLDSNPRALDVVAFAQPLF